MTISPAQLDKIRALFFDLDGTLLQVEMNQFIPTYLNGLARHLEPQVDPVSFRSLSRKAIIQLLESRERCENNRSRFLRQLQIHAGIQPPQFEQALQAFCSNGLEDMRPLVKPLAEINLLLDTAFSSGCQVVIATNPVFPREIIDARLRWGGMENYPFALVTDWENSRLCKPAPGYFEDLLEHFGLQPDEVLMVGNDTAHDLAAEEVGIKTLLVDTWLIEREGGRRASWRGDHQGLLGLLRKLV